MLGVPHHREGGPEIPHVPAAGPRHRPPAVGIAPQAGPSVTQEEPARTHRGRPKARFPLGFTLGVARSAALGESRMACVCHCGGERAFPAASGCVHAPPRRLLLVLELREGHGLCLPHPSPARSAWRSAAGRRPHGPDAGPRRAQAWGHVSLSRAWCPSALYFIRARITQKPTCRPKRCLLP